MFISFLMMTFDVVLPNCKSSSLVIKELGDLILPARAVIEMLTIMNVEYACLRSDSREKCVCDHC